MRRFVLTLLSCMIIMCSQILHASEPVYLSGLLIQPSSTASRFTFILNKKTYGKIRYLPNPDRVEIEFADTYKHFDMESTSLRGSNVKSIDTEESASGLVRFTFHINGEPQWKIEFLPEDSDGGVRLQLTISTIEHRAMNVIAKNNVIPAQAGIRPDPRLRGDDIPSGNDKQNKPTPLQKVFENSALTTFNTLTSELENRPGKEEELIERSKIETHEVRFPTKPKQPFTIVIDAGHGGKDAGAVGENGKKEKDIVLSIAKKLAAKINAHPNMRAVLTRNGDYFVPLRKRLKLAREGKADLFIAIHADAYFENDATGASVFALSQRGASNEAARWLAQRENYSELGGVELDALTDRDPILRSVLVDLAQTTTIQDSLRLGNKVLDALDDISSLHYSHVERAPFVVLKSPDIPSILVETGFITNPKEEKRLASAAYQDQLALALKQGITQYVQQYAVRGE